MKRILLLVVTAVVTVLLLGWLRVRERAFATAAATLLERQAQTTNAAAEAVAEQAELRQKISGQKAEIVRAGQTTPLSPALLEWFLAGDFSQVPASLVPELRSALALPQNLSADFVLLSKPSLRGLAPDSPRGDNKVPAALSAVLSLSSEQRQEIEAALAGSRREFSDWARQNLQREGPKEDTIVRYTIPPANEVADSITNRLFAQLTATMGPQRRELFYTFADSWFQLETGYLGTITNTLSVLRRPGSDGQPSLLYQLTREGAISSLREGPNSIQPEFFPPAWRNVFPDGWAEVAQREGFEFPPEKAAAKQH